MSKSIVFRKNVICQYGDFRAGDMAKNIDDKFAADMIATGAAEATNGDPKQTDNAADGAGRMSKTSAGHVDKVEHTFTPTDTGKMAALGVIKTDPNADAPKASTGPAGAPAASAPPAATPEATKPAPGPTAAQTGSPAAMVADKTAPPTPPRSQSA